MHLIYHDEKQTEATDRPVVEINEAMIEAGESAIWSSVGGADLGGWFSARDLAVQVFQAMAAAGCGEHPLEHLTKLQLVLAIRSESA